VTRKGVNLLPKVRAILMFLLLVLVAFLLAKMHIAGGSDGSQFH
jgi:hypothetical protein